MMFKRLDKKEFKKLTGKASDSETNRNHLMLSFIDFDFDPYLITKNLGLNPISAGKKGDEYFIGAQKDILRINDCNYWDYEWKITTNDWIGDLIERFFKEIIVPRFDTIKEIGSDCQTTRFTIVQYYFTGHNPGYGFEKEQIKILADLNAEIELDIYCLCDDEKNNEPTH